MKALATTIKRSVLITLAALTLGLGATAAIDTGVAEAGFKRECLRATTDDEFERCVNPPRVP